MNGVEILSSETVYTTEMCEWLLLAFVVAGLLVGLIIFIADWIDSGFDAGGIFLVIACTLVGLFLGAIGLVVSIHETDTVDHIEYKVTVSEEVNFVEFIDKYEIIEQEGKIFTVRERE